MKVVVKKSALDQIVKQLSEERSYHSRRIDQIAGDEQPVLPDAQMATQLSTQRVPVEDPDFLPVNTRDLSVAAAEIAGKVSPGKIQKFYSALKTLLRKSSDPVQYKGMSETDLMEAKGTSGLTPEDLAAISGEAERQQASTAATYQSMLKRRAKIRLADLAAGDAGSILDAILKKNPDAPLPKTADEAKISISILTGTKAYGDSKQNGEKIEIPTVTLTFSSPMLPSPGKKTYDGGAIPLEGGGIYHVVDPFPFTLQQYEPEFMAAFETASKKMTSDSEASAAKSAESELKDQEPESEVDKKKRAATMQKSISIDLAIRDAAAMRQEDPKKLEKLLGKISPGMTLASFDALTDEKRDQVLSNVVSVLDKERGPYYAVGEMDYLRDIFDDEAEAKYSVKDGKITSIDPVATGVEKLAESFFTSCFEPLMSYVFEESLDNREALASFDLESLVSLYALDSYEDFVENVDNIDAWIDLVLSSTRSIVVKDPSIFDNVMPEFGKIRKAVETKGDLSEYESRLRMLGIEDVGRLRAIFQYLKLPVAFMKAIKTTVQIKALEGKTGNADKALSPEKTEKMIKNYIEKQKNEDPVSLFTSNRKSLRAAGLGSPSEVSGATTDEIFNAIGKSLSQNLARSVGSMSSAVNSDEINEEIEEAISDFALMLEPDFSEMGDPTNPSAKPALLYAKQFIEDMQLAAEGDEVFDMVSPEIIQTINELLGAKKTKKK